MVSDREMLRRIIQDSILDVFRICGDKKNFTILNKIIASGEVVVDDLRNEMGPVPPTRMPFNRRINLMVQSGVLERTERKRKVHVTPLGKTFAAMVQRMQHYMKKNADIVLRSPQEFS